MSQPPPPSTEHLAILTNNPGRKIVPLPPSRSLCSSPPLVAPLTSPAKTLQKRSLLHPPIPHASSIDPKVVYISSKTPFISAVKRVTAYLDAAETAQKSKNQKITSKEKQNEDAGVTLKATGRAIDKCLQLGTFFMGQNCEVRVRTGSVNVVDDVVDLPEGAVKQLQSKKRKKDDMEIDENEDEGDGEVEMVTRMTSSVEILVFRKEKTRGDGI
jgi:ribonuclease P/MRP protein subunit POP7